MNDKKRSFKFVGKADCLFNDGASLTSLRDQFIFLTGGHKKFIAKAKRYDLKRDKWEQLPELNVGRCNHSSCTIGNALYVIGGRDI